MLLKYYLYYIYEISNPFSIQIICHTEVTKKIYLPHSNFIRFHFLDAAGTASFRRP